MGRPAKDYVNISIKMDSQIHSRLESHCNDKKITKTKVIEKALDAYLKDQDWKANILTKKDRML